MKNHLKIFISLQVILLLSALILIVSSFGYTMGGLPEAFYIRDVRVSIDGGTAKEITLPYAFKDLRPRTPITITASVHPKENDLIYIKTAYAPAKVYTNGELIYELGKKEFYPSFMIDPATEIYLANPSVFDKEAEFKMEFLSPVTRSSMTIHPPIMTTFKSIFNEMLKAYKTSFFFSVVQLAVGVFLSIISLMLIFFEKRISKIFFWLGMFSFTSGLWAFGECNFTALMIKNPTLLYLFAFIGLFTFPIPLIHLAVVSIGFRNPKPLYCLSSFLNISVAVGIGLQLLGLYQLSSSMYVFHIIIPCSLCILSSFVIYEAVKNSNLQAKRFVVPILILSLSSVMEVVNYYFRFTYKFASLFQDGVIVFILLMGLTIGFYIKDFAIVRKQNERLAFEMGLMSIQMKEQKKYNELIAENEESLKKQRHDLHHHLIAIRELSENKNEKLSQYLDSLIQNIPTSYKKYCENKAVSAILSHYAAICEEEQISFESRLIVPETSKTPLSGDLSIIFGNLLENAIEACMKIDKDKRFIRISSNVNYELLVITMDNCYDGSFVSENGRFRSAKRKDFGIGLSSIQSVARKYHGDAKFEDKDGYFQSSVYMRIESV